MNRATRTERQAGISSIAILGADTMLAALPATPVQLAHACLQIGYDLSIPASWGDELIAAECLHQLADRGARPAVMCACPLVRDELLAVGPDLGPMLLPLVSPPVAAARYLRTLYGRDRVHLTYIGGCPAGADQELDLHRTPGEFLASLATAGINLTDQPKVFDSVIPPDRRRFFSVAGGVPSAEQLWSAGNGRSLIELDGEDYLIDLAQHLLSHECALIDLAPRLGCACSGASAAIPARSARAAVAVIDPPRASGAVVDMTVALELTDPIPSAGPVMDREPDDDRTGSVPAAPSATDAHPVSTSTQTPAVAPVGERPVAPRRRRSPSAGIRSIQASVPVAHVAGRRLPRAYVASRRPGQAVSLRKDIEPSLTRVPSPIAASESVGDENGRSRGAARVAASSRPSGKAGPAAAVAAAAAGAPERMSDGPPS